MYCGCRLSRPVPSCAGETQIRAPTSQDVRLAGGGHRHPDPFDAMLRRVRGEGKAGSRTLSAVSAPDPGDLPSEQVYNAFVEDFGGAWTSIMRRQPPGRGNFMFALMAMGFLEWCGRVTEKQPDAQQRFLEALKAADPIYFAELPTRWPARGRPSPLFATGREFLWVLFNMVRNGIAHGYVQLDVDLADPDVRMRVQITGPEERPQHRAGTPRPPNYLVPTQLHGSLGLLDDTGHDAVIVRLHPDVLFADVQFAADAASVTTLPPATWTRTKLGTTAAQVIALRGG